MKNTIEGFNIRLDETNKKKINELEDSSVKSIELESKKKKDEEYR